MEEKLKSHFLSLYCMIVADQDVSTLELTELYRIGKEHYGLDDKEINFAIISEGPGFYSPERVEDKIKYLYELALIACADGKIEDEEKILLEKYALKFGFLDENINSIIDFLLKNAIQKNTLEKVLNMFNN